MRRNRRQQKNKNPMKEKLRTNIDTSDLLIESRPVFTNRVHPDVKSAYRKLTSEHRFIA
jgi:hypothetical protein